MKFYIASKYENAPAVRAAIAELTKLGHIITHDWTTSEASHWDWDEPGATEQYAPIASAADVQGVRDADVLIVLTHDYRMMIGAHVELGVALGLGKMVYIVGEQPRNIFAYHPGVSRVNSLDMVLAELSVIEDELSGVWV